MPEPITLAVLSGIGSSLGGIVTFANLVYDLKNTPDDVKVCLDAVARVNTDIQYAVTLRTKNLKLLSETPVELARLDQIIVDAERSIFDVGRLLEGCRREVHGEKVPLMKRMKWVLGDSSAFARRTPNLQQQHAAINLEITQLRQLEALKPLRDLGSNTMFENPELLSMRRKRSSSSLSSHFLESNLNKSSSLRYSKKLTSAGGRSPPPYNPNLPAYPSIQEEEDTYDFVLDNHTNSPSPSMNSSNWQTSVEPLCLDSIGFASCQNIIPYKPPGTSYMPNTYAESSSPWMASSNWENESPELYQALPVSSGNRATYGDSAAIRRPNSGMRSPSSSITSNNWQNPIELAVPYPIDPVSSQNWFPSGNSAAEQKHESGTPSLSPSIPELPSPYPATPTNFQTELPCTSTEAKYVPVIGAHTQLPSMTSSNWQSLIELPTPYPAIATNFTNRIAYISSKAMGVPDHSPRLPSPLMTSNNWQTPESLTPFVVQPASLSNSFSYGAGYKLQGPAEKYLNSKSSDDQASLIGTSQTAYSCAESRIDDDKCLFFNEGNSQGWQAADTRSQTLATIIRDGNEEDDDTEAAFYRDLKLQEDERRFRRQERMRRGRSSE